MDFPLITFDSSTGIASVGIPKAPRRLTGIDKLIQVVVLAVLKNGDQDVISPDLGSGLRSMIGQFNFSNPSEIRVEVIQRVKNIEQQIIVGQSDFNLPSSEKLSQLKVIDLVTDSSTGATAVRLKINNQAGQTSTVVV